MCCHVTVSALLTDRPGWSIELGARCLRTRAHRSVRSAGGLKVRRDRESTGERNSPALGPCRCPDDS